jgi:phosphoserine phosphatase
VKFRLLLMDMDSTLINEEGIDLLAEYAGVGDQVVRLTEEAMTGTMDFYTSLRRRVGLLDGQPISLLNQVTQSLSLTEGAEDLIRALKERGWKVGVVSGGFHEIIDPYLAPLPLDFIRANRFSSQDGFLTGSVIEPIIGPEEKAHALREFAAEFNIGIEETVSMGDGANDRAMLLEAGLGIAFCAKAALKEVADLVIEERDLRLLLNFL